MSRHHVRPPFHFGFGFIVVAVALVLAACGNGTEPDTMASAANDAATSATLPAETTAEDGDAEDGNTGAVEQPETDDDSDPEIPEPTTTVLSPIDLAGTAGEGGDGDQSEGVDEGIEPPAEPFWDVELLGPSMVGVGEYVRLTEPGPDGGPSDDEDEECGLGWLGYLVDGTVHRYEELGRLGHTRLFNGPRGQDAIVVSCEESTERVLVQGSAVLPDDGIPRFIEFELGQPYLLDFDADFGWRGDLFGGYGWHAGWDELVYFDTGSGFVVEAATLLGTRVEQHDHGFDIIVPDGWEVLTGEAATVTIAIGPTDAASYISVLSLSSALDPEFPEGAELLDFWTDEVPVWDYVSVDRGVIVDTQTRFNWRLDHEGGSLVVQHLEAGDRDLVVAYYIAPGEEWLWDLAQAVTDQIRHYQYATVG